MDAGGLRDLVKILEYTQQDGVWQWCEKRRAYGAAEEGTGKCIFSLGLGGRKVELTLRRQPIGYDNALLWRGRHCHIQSILEGEPGFLQVTAAQVEPRPCTAHDVDGESLPFAGIVLEKYVKYAQEVPMDLNQTTYILVTPKVIRLKPGTLVEIGGEAYHILLAHVLEEHRNEYEIIRTVDL